jgi:hypothetical protein
LLHLYPGTLIVLPTSPKPIFDAAIQLHLLAVLGDTDILRATSFPDAHTFPSDRATMYAGLAPAVSNDRREGSRLPVNAAADQERFEIRPLIVGHQSANQGRSP